MLQQPRDFIVWAASQKYAPIFTRDLQPGSEIVTALRTEPHWVVLALLDQHAEPPVDSSNLVGIRYWSQLNGRLP